MYMTKTRPTYLAMPSLLLVIYAQEHVQSVSIRNNNKRLRITSSNCGSTQRCSSTK